VSSSLIFRSMKGRPEEGRLFLMKFQFPGTRERRAGGGEHFPEFYAKIPLQCNYFQRIISFDSVVGLLRPCGESKLYVRYVRKEELE